MSAAAKLKDYFEQIYQDTEGYVYAPVKRDGRIQGFMIPWPRRADGLVEHVLRYAADESAEVFYSPALYKSRKPVQEEVLGSWVAWAEFDGNFPESWPTGVAPIPSIEIQSSTPNKRHVYWALEEFTGPKKIQEINRSLAYALGADLSGWDANQFLRPPYSVHRKGSPLPVKLLHNRLDRIYEHSDFNGVPTPREAISASVSFDSLPDIESVLAEAKWDRDLLELFRESAASVKSTGRDRSGAIQRLAYEGAEHGWSDEQIMAVIVDADDRWEKYTNRTPAARKKILVDVVNRARAKVGYVTGDELTGLAKALGAPVKVQDPVLDDDQVLFSIQELASLKGIEDWIVKDLFTPRGLGLFTGRPGVGKTQLAFQLAADIASSRPEFLDRGLESTGETVLFLSLEMNKYQLPHIAGPVYERYPDLNQRKLVVYAKGEMLPLDQESGQAYFEALLEKIKPKVVIIDSLSHMASAELTSDTDMKTAFEFLQRVRNDYDFGLIIIHHHRKKANDAQSKKRPNDLSDVYGSFYITAAVDFVLDLEERGDDAEQGTITLSVLKNRYAAVPEPVKIVRNNKLHFEINDVSNFIKGTGTMLLRTSASRSLLDWLYEHPGAPVAVDTETTGLKVADGRDRCIGVSLTARVDGDLQSVYIPVAHRLGENADELTIKKLRYVLRQGRTLIYANCQFDFLSLETIGIRVSEAPFYDIQTQANLVREDWPFMKDLDSLYRVYVNGEHSKLKEWEYAIYDEGKKKPRLRTTLEWQKKNGWPHTTPEMVDDYACRDTEATYETWEALCAHPAWKEQPESVWEHKQKLIRVLVEMRRRGIEVDVELAAELEAEGVIAKEKLLEDMEGLNPSSVTDAPKIFLGKLNLPVLKLTEGGKDKDPAKQKPSFTAAVLEEYDMILENREGGSEEERKWIANVRAWRGWSTALGLLLRPYQELVSPDGRLRTSYTTHVTSTGRLSSREPNLQQISKEADGKPWKDRIKKCFRAKPGFVLLSADYSQLELRLAVAYAQEPELQQIFLEGRDIFTEMAAELGWERPKTKSFVYATQYGGGDARIAYIFNVSLAQAKVLRERFYKRYPRFRRLDMACRQKVEDTKKLRLWSGRIRHFRSTSDSYKAMNALLQGGAADIVERVWVYVMENLDNEDCRCLLQVHDALVFEVREDLADEYAVKIQEVMENVNEICAPDTDEPLFPVKFSVDVTRWE